jgi:hypothetical protein
MAKLSAPRRRALAILERFDSPASSREVARRLWPDGFKKHSKQGVGGQWLPGRAARMLYAMNKDGLVCVFRTSRGQALYSISKMGLWALFSDEASA